MDIEYNFRKDLVKLMVLWYGEYTDFRVFDGWKDIEKEVLRTLAVWKLAGKLGNTYNFRYEFKELLMKYAFKFDKDAPLPTEYYILLNLIDEDSGNEIEKSGFLNKYTKLVLRDDCSYFFDDSTFIYFCYEFAFKINNNCNCLPSRFFKNVVEIDATDFVDYTDYYNRYRYLKKEGIFSHFDKLEYIAIGQDTFCWTDRLCNNFAHNPLLRHIDFKEGTSFSKITFFSQTFMGCSSLKELRLQGLREDATYIEFLRDSGVKKLSLVVDIDLPSYRQSIYRIIKDMSINYLDIRNKSKNYIVVQLEETRINRDEKFTFKYADDRCVDEINFRALWRMTLDISSRYSNVHYILQNKLAEGLKGFIAQEECRTDCIRTFEFAED